jgi:proline iminopeptidase
VRALRDRAGLGLERALPRVTRVILPGVGHVPWLEAPDSVGPLVLDFVRSTG